MSAYDNSFLCANALAIYLEMAIIPYKHLKTYYYWPLGFKVNCSDLDKNTFKPN